MGCVSNRVKNLIFWSIQKATFDLSSYGWRERISHTRAIPGCLQFDFNLVVVGGWLEGSLVDLGY